MKKRASGSPASLQGAVAGANDAIGVSTPGEKQGFGASHKATDLEDGELEYARTPSPPARAIPTVHGSASSHGTLGPPSLAPVIGRQTSLSQHLSQVPLIHKSLGSLSLLVRHASPSFHLLLGAACLVALICVVYDELLLVTAISLAKNYHYSNPPFQILVEILV